MTPRSPRLRWLIVPIVAFGLVAAGCGSSGSGGKKGAGTSSKQPKLAAATLNGSGSTFQAAFDQQVITKFGDVQPGVTINYAGGGSGKGKTDLAAQIVDFAGTDSLVKPADVAKYGGRPFLYFPTVAAPITLSYNVSGLSKLQLSAETIAKIFGRQVTKWSDPSIALDNPGVNLPGTDITVVHRSDGSGTTSNFSKYLVAAAPGVWTLGGSDTINWPAGELAGAGNQGVAQIVKSTTGAIGYVDYSDAKASGLSVAAVKNKAGQYVKPTLDGASAAVAGATVNPDLTYDPLDVTGARAYPLTSPTWILVYKNQTDKAKGTAVKAFLGYIYGEGQSLASSVDYASLPASLVDRAKAQIAQIVVPA